MAESYKMLRIRARTALCRKSCSSSASALVLKSFTVEHLRCFDRCYTVLTTKAHSEDCNLGFARRFRQRRCGGPCGNK